MPIQRFSQDHAFDPEAIAVMTKAFEDSLSSLDVNRADPIAEIVAKKIIECALQSERDPIRLRDYAMKAIKS